MWIFCCKKNFGGWLPLQVQKIWIVRLQTKEPQSFMTTKRVVSKLERKLHSNVSGHLHSVLINWNVTYRNVKRNAFRPKNRWLGKLRALPECLFIGGGSFVKSCQWHKYFQSASMLNVNTWLCYMTVHYMLHETWCSHSSGNSDFCLLGCNITQSQRSVFRF